MERKDQRILEMANRLASREAVGALLSVATLCKIVRVVAMETGRNPRRNTPPSKETSSH